MVLFEVVKFLIKDYVVNSCLANPDNEAVSHSEACSTNLWASWGVVMVLFEVVKFFVELLSAYLQKDSVIPYIYTVCLSVLTS